MPPKDIAFTDPNKHKENKLNKRGGPAVFRRISPNRKRALRRLSCS
jgi:hypothetical protein